MQKDFDTWNIQKKYIHELSNQRVLFSEREVWWCALGENIGDEENGKNDLFERPVLIVRKFSVNTVIIFPLTTKGKADSVFYHKISSDLNSSVILSQIRLISSKRLLRKMYKLGRGEFTIIKAKAINLIF
jgi:mRNA interferase MazF